MDPLDIKQSILEHLYVNNATSSRSKICIREHLKTYGIPDLDMRQLLVMELLAQDRYIDIPVIRDVQSLGFQNHTLDNCGEILTFITQDGIEVIKKPDISQITDDQVINTLLLKMWMSGSSTAVEPTLRLEGIKLGEPRLKSILERMQREGFAKPGRKFTSGDTYLEITGPAMEMLQQYGSYMEYKKAIKTDDESPGTIHVQITGEGNIVMIGSGNTITATITINKGNASDLEREMKKIGISEEEVMELLAVLENDTPDHESKRFGEKVHNWFMKKFDLAINGAWQVSIGTAGGLLVEMVKRYYGWQ